jgi:surface antigen
MNRAAFPAVAGLALLLAGGAALAANPVELLIDGTLSGVVGPKLATGGAVRRSERALGAALGDFAEVQLGRKLPATDRERHDDAAATALWLTPGGTPIGWRNFRTRIRGEVTPDVGLFRNGDLICRGYAEHIVLAPKDERRFAGVACWDEGQASWTATARTADVPGLPTGR